MAEMIFSSPLSYSWSAASTQRPKSPPPPPSTQKRHESGIQTPSILFHALESGSPQPHDGDVQKLLHYIDNLSFSSAVVSNDHTLCSHERDQEDVKNGNSAFQSPKVPMQSVLQNRSMNHANSSNLPQDSIAKSQEFPELTPIRKKQNPPHSPPCSKTAQRMDPLGATPLKAKENLLHEASRYICTKDEEPNGSSPIRTNEVHLLRSSRHYLSDDDSSASSLLPDRKMERTRASSSFFATKATELYLDKSVAPTPSRPRHKLESRSSPRKSLEPSLEHSMDEAWSIVLGSTIIEQSEAEDQNEQEQPTTEMSRDHLLLGSATPVISRSGNILDDLPDEVKSPEDAKKLLRTAVHTLQDARAERESARQWATEMKDSVHKWVEQQRQFASTESNLTESHAWQQFHFSSLSNLEGSIQKLCQEVQSSNKKRASIEERLHYLLIDQREKIQSMAVEVLSMKQQMQQMEKQVVLPQGTNTPTHEEKVKVTPKSSVKSRMETPSRSTASSTTSSRIRKEGKNGGHIIIYGNGVRKEVHKDGTTVIRFTNGDVETKFSGGTTAYFHAKDQVMQINNTADGSTLFEYPNRQIERHYKDGSKAILFADGTRQRISAEGKVDTAFVKV